MNANKYQIKSTIIGSNDKACDIRLNGEYVLYSYDTPIAILRKSGKVALLIKSASRTTMKHINLWLKIHHAELSEKDRKAIEIVSGWNR